MNEFRFAFRQLRKNPGFATIAVLTLALGIGANTTIFSVVNGVLLRPLPYPAPERLVAVCESNARLGLPQYVTSVGAYADWHRQNSVFEKLAAATVLGPLTIRGKMAAEQVQVGAVTADFFPLLGLQPILGRQFASEEENPDRGNVVLLSEGLWRERFAADPGVLNQSVWLGDRSFTVVGVMPASVKLFDPAGVKGWDNGFAKSELWRPLPVDSGLSKQRSYRAFFVLGRLKPQVSLTQAQTEMTSIASRQAQAYPDSNAGWTITVQSWQQTVVRQARLPLVLLMGAVGFVLLIATANLANLCLARAVSRQKEFAIRMALGAGRLRMVKQFLTESLWLSGLGGAVGWVFTYWSLKVLVRLIPAEVPRADEISLDVRVLGFTLAASLVVGLLIGLSPVLMCWRGEASRSLKSEARGATASVSSHRFRSLLVTAEVALAVVLLIGAGLLTRSFRRLNEVNLGFQPQGLAAMDVTLEGSGYTNELRRIQSVAQLLTLVAELPGVESSSAVAGLPLDAGHANMDIALTSIEGIPPASPDKKLVAGLRLVSPDYFLTMGIALAKGRFFTQRDTTNSPPVVLINETLARRYFSGREPVGQRIGSPDFGPQPCEIVGVVHDVKQGSIEATPQPEVVRPLLQECFFGVTLVARSRAAPAQIFATLGAAVARVDRSWPASNPRTLDQLVSASLALRRFALLLMSLFGGLALLLAMLGIYGVLSCVINERIREIGIRLALGAQRGEVRRLVLSRGMRSVAVGGLIGLVGACALAPCLRGLLYEVTPIDPLTFGVVAVFLAVAALFACWLPAQKAVKVDPSEALRYE
jgi:putative ABC transport system permease protein